MRRPPRHGSSRARSVYGGAEHASFLASGLFTGESSWKPPRRRRSNFSLSFRELGVRPAGQGGFLAESRESTCWIPLATEATTGSHPRGASPEGFDSKRKNGLTFLAPLTYPLIIEELRPEETPRGRFCFSLIADPDRATGACRRLALVCPHCPGSEPHPWTLSLRRARLKLGR